jgi:nucleoside-diphosphate kinase
MQKTLVVIKPDAVKRDLVGKIISRFEKEKFLIKNIGMIPENINDEFWKLFYIQHIKKDFFDELLAYVSSGAAIAIILEYNGGNAIQAARDLIGPLPPNAPKGTIRGDYAIDSRKNAIHGSDSEKSFKWENKVCKQFGIFCHKKD